MSYPQQHQASYLPPDSPTASRKRPRTTEMDPPDASSAPYEAQPQYQQGGYYDPNSAPPPSAGPETAQFNMEHGDDDGDDDDDEGPTRGRGGGDASKAGRRKIKIEFIQDKSRRHITFSKRKAGIMKKAYELSTLTGTQVLLLVVSETGLVYTFTTAKLQPLVTQPEGKNLIQSCLNAPTGGSSSTPSNSSNNNGPPPPSSGAPPKGGRNHGLSGSSSSSVPPPSQPEDTSPNPNPDPDTSKRVRRRTEVAVPTGLPGQAESVQRRNTMPGGEPPAGGGGYEGYHAPPPQPGQEAWTGGEYTLGPGGPGGAYAPPPPPQGGHHAGPPAPGYHPQQVAGAGWGGDYAVRR